MGTAVNSVGRHSSLMGGGCTLASNAALAALSEACRDRDFRLSNSQTRQHELLMHIGQNDGYVSS